MVVEKAAAEGAKAARGSAAASTWAHRFRGVGAARAGEGCGETW